MMLESFFACLFVLFFVFVFSIVCFLGDVNKFECRERKIYGCKFIWSLKNKYIINWIGTVGLARAQK